MQDFDIEIMGHQYDVKFVPQAEVQAYGDDGEDNTGKYYGRFMQELMGIRMWEGAHPSKKQEILLHELIHAMDAELNLELSEHQTGLLAGLMWTTFKKRPDVVEMIFGGDDAKRDDIERHLAAVNSVRLAQ